ncbi:hypothetical protein VST7929_01673 [Vibrio stylophorae]|uniref:Lipoprotein n=1 Tax=Vibrio stylophorae TaxID=659351 RepID=A0ABM8ZU04_9VIBR|nr:hypothetical protein [Vibrio stylophorae]CAH0533798.1 hypothetical protein VST7929_01673 [Vibrio stylophorae]
MLAAFLTGCAGLSAHNLFSHYSQAMQPARQAILYQSPQAAYALLPDQPAGPMLGDFEQGRVALQAGDLDLSFTAFNQAAALLSTWRQEAKYQLSEGANTLGSLLTNDNMRSYQPADYEQVMVHYYLMLHYLQARDLQGALVEVRRANLRQDYAKRMRAAELQAAQKEANQQGLSMNVGALLARYPDSQSLSAVQNGAVFYLSALLYQAAGQLDDAYIDLQRALAVAPNNKMLAAQAMVLAKRLHRQDDLRLLEQRYGQAPRWSSTQGQLVVLDEQGLVAAPHPWQLPLAIYDSQGYGAIYQLTLPYYPNAQGPLPQGEVLLNQHRLALSPLVSLSKMAVQQLSEAMPGIVLRQALRIYAKDQLRRVASDEGEEVGNLLANIFNVLTDQADTRSWQTLPDQIGMSVVALDPGMHTLAWQGYSISVEIKPGQRTLVWLSRQGQSLQYWQGQLGEF